MTQAAQPPVGLDELESLMDRAWPAPEAELLDGWIMRSAGSVTRRANSVWPASTPSNAETALRTAAAWYSARCQPVIFQLTDRPENAALEGLLDREGYTRQSETVIMTAAGPGTVLTAAGTTTSPGTGARRGNPPVGPPLGAVAGAVVAR